MQLLLADDNPQSAASVLYICRYTSGEMKNAASVGSPSLVSESVQESAQSWINAGLMSVTLVQQRAVIAVSSRLFRTVVHHKSVLTEAI